MPEADDREESEGGDEEEFDLSDYFDDDDTPDYKLSANNRAPMTRNGRSPQRRPHLHRTPEGPAPTEADRRPHRDAGREPIGNLDEDGYLRRELDAIVNDLAFTQNVRAPRRSLNAP